MVPKKRLRALSLLVALKCTPFVITFQSEYRGSAKSTGRHPSRTTCRSAFGGWKCACKCNARQLASCHSLRLAMCSACRPSYSHPSAVCHAHGWVSQQVSLSVCRKRPPPKEQAILSLGLVSGPSIHAPLECNELRCHNHSPGLGVHRAAVSAKQCPHGHVPNESLHCIFTIEPDRNV